MERLEAFIIITIIIVIIIVIVDRHHHHNHNHNSAYLLVLFLVRLLLQFLLGPVSQRVTIKHTIAQWRNRVLRKNLRLIANLL